MSIFKKIFGRGTAENGAVKSAGTVKKQGSSTATLTFGRYTDCNKGAKQLDHWNKSINAFKDKKYVDSFEHFLHYVRDEEVDNLKVTRNGDSVEFELIQGSKIVTGKGDSRDFVAESKIAQMDKRSIPVMRKLMSLNYGLRYSKFALNSNVLCMKFSSHAIDASPNKLYASLKELAKKADQQDDLLLSEFSSLKEVDMGHSILLDSAVQEVKYEALIDWINHTKVEVDKLDTQKMSGGIAFLLLDLTYRIDYLICPQGLLTDALEKIQSMFFKKSNATTTERNNQILAEFDKLVTMPKEKIIEGLYDVKCTFGIANAAAHKTVMDMMFKEREKVGWYRDNGYPHIMEAVYGYMVSYAFFNYGMIYPATNLLNIAMHVLNPDFYAKMGDKNKFVNSDKTLNGKAITQSINGILKNAKKDYPFIRMNTATLRFNSSSSFIDSLILEMDKFDLRKK